MQQSLKSENGGAAQKSDTGSERGDRNIPNAATAFELAIADAVRLSYPGPAQSSDAPVKGNASSPSGTSGKAQTIERSVHLGVVSPPESNFGVREFLGPVPSDRLEESAVSVEKSVSGGAGYRPVADANSDFLDASLRESAPSSPARSVGTPAPDNDDGEWLANTHEIPEENGVSPSGAIGPFLIAGLASAAWMGGCGAYAWSFYQAGAPLTLSAILALLAITFIPVPSFVMVAVIVSRAREMRLLSARMLHVATHLSRHGEMTETIGGRIKDAVRSEIATIGTGIEQAVSRAVDLEAMVHREVSSLERIYDRSESRFQHLVQEMAAERKAIMSSAQTISEVISTNREAFNASVSSMVQHVSETVSVANREINDLFENQTAMTTSKLVEGSTKIIDRLCDTGSEIAGKLSVAVQEAESKISESADFVVTKVSSEAEKVDTMLRQRSAEVESSLSSQVGGLVREMTMQFGSVSTGLEEQGTRIAEQAGRVGQQAEDLAQLMTSKIAEADGAISRCSQVLVENIVKSSREMEDFLALRNKEMDKILVTRMGEVENIWKQGFGSAASLLDEGSARFESMLSEKAESINELLDAKASLIEQSLNDSAHTLRESLNDGSAIAARLDQAASGISAVLQEREVELESWVTNQMAKVDSLVSRGSSRIMTEAVAAAERIDGIFSSRMDDIGRSLEDGGSALGQSVSECAGRVLEAVELSSDRFVKISSEREQAIRDSLEQATDSLSQKLNQCNEDVFRNILHKGQNISGLLLQATRTAELQLDEYSSRLMNSVEGSKEVGIKMISDILESLAVADRRLTFSLSESGDRLRAITSDMSTYSGDLKEVVDDVMTRAVPATDQIETRIASLRSELDSTLNQMSSFVEHCWQQSTMLSDSRNVVENIDSKLENSIQSHSVAVEKMVQELESRARNIGDVVNNLVTEVQTSMAGVENRAAKITQSLTETVSASSETLRNGGSVLISNAERSLTTIESAVRERCGQIQSEIEETVHKVENRFEGINVRIRDASASLLDDIRNIRAELAAGLAELPADAQEVTNTMHRLIADQVRAMDELGRIVAQHADEHEVESVSPVDTLPETEESRPEAQSLRDTAATANVAREGENFPSYRKADWATPIVRSKDDSSSARQTSGDRRWIGLPHLGATGTAKSSNALGEGPVSAQNSLHEARRFSGTARSSARTDMDSAPSWSLPDLLAKVKAEEYRAEQGNRNADSSKKDQWNIAPAVSVDQAVGQKGSGQSEFQPLDSLSIGLIGQSVSDVPLETWISYRQGKKSGIANWIRPLCDQMTFKNVRQKYLDDSDFRTIVDRYVNDFESLISATLEEDPKGVSARNNLNSDAGKSYLVLACASGRFFD